METEMSSKEQLIKELYGLYEDLYEVIDEYMADKLNMSRCEDIIDAMIEDIELKKQKINKVVGLEKTFHE